MRYGCQVLNTWLNFNSNLEETLFSYLMNVPLELLWTLFSPLPRGGNIISVSYLSTFNCGENRNKYLKNSHSWCDERGKEPTVSSV